MSLPSILLETVIYGAILSAIYIAVISMVGIRALHQRRDQLYSLKHAEFEERKKRVGDQLRKDALDE